MHAEIFQANYDELETIAKKFDETAEDVFNLLKYIDTHMDGLQGGGWISPAADAFYAEMNDDLFPAISRLGRALDDAAQFTRDTIATIQAAEELAARAFNGETVVLAKAAASVSERPPHNSFLPEGWKLKIIKRDGRIKAIIYDENGNPIKMPDDLDSWEVLAAMREWVGNGGKASTFAQHIADGKWQHVRASSRAREYMRRFPGWGQAAKRLGAVGTAIDVATVGYDSVQLIRGENGDFYVTTELARLPDGTVLVSDRLVKRDTDKHFVEDVASVGGGIAGAALGAKGGAAAGAAIGVWFGGAGAVPGAAIGAVVGGGAGAFGGSEGAKAAAGAIYDGSMMDYDPPVDAPTSDISIHDNGVSVSGENNRVDINRLLKDNGEVTIYFENGDMVMEAQTDNGGNYNLRNRDEAPGWQITNP